VMAEQVACHFDELRPELQREQRQNQKADKSSCEDCGQKVAESHFKRSRSEDEEFKRRRRRQHRGEHQRPEFMFFERCVDSAKPLDGQSLPEQHFPARVADQVQDDAADSRSRRCQDHVEEELGRLLVDVPGHDRIHGKPEERCVHSRNHEYAPRAQRR